VRANYLFAGAADLYLESGDPALWTSLEAIWQNVTTTKLYVTGGCGALYDGASPDGSVQQSGITRVHQAYGRNYQLPNLTAHNETCAAVGNVLWNWRMFLASADARYIDVLELSLYNAVLSGVSLAGTDYFYVNPLRNENPLPAALRWSRTRLPFVTSYCCPPNVVRTISQVNGYAYATQRDAILVNLYGANHYVTQLGGAPVQIVQQSNYPWDGSVRLTIDRSPPQPFALKLRIPGWAEQWRLRVNGERVRAERTADGYLTIHRPWKADDIVALDLAMPVQLLESHPLVEETRNQLAVKRGPIVYCLESPDLPADVRVRDIAVSPSTEFKIVHGFEALAGVTVLEAKLICRQGVDWDDRLYRPLRQDHESSRTVLHTRLVPYFAWSNRGESEMSVWLPKVDSIAARSSLIRPSLGTVSPARGRGGEGTRGHATSSDRGEKRHAHVISPARRGDGAALRLPLAARSFDRSS
jgi:DUF1680 family protein